MGGQRGENNIYADDSKTITELKDAIFRELGHLTSQLVDKAITESGTVRLLVGTLSGAARALTTGVKLVMEGTLVESPHPNKKKTGRFSPNLLSKSPSQALDGSS